MYSVLHMLLLKCLPGSLVEMPKRQLEQGMVCRSEAGVLNTDLEAISRHLIVQPYLLFSAHPGPNTRLRHFTALFHSGFLNTSGGGNDYPHLHTKGQVYKSYIHLLKSCNRLVVEFECETKLGLPDSRVEAIALFAQLPEVDELKQGKAESHRWRLPHLGGERQRRKEPVKGSGKEAKGR